MVSNELDLCPSCIEHLCLYDVHSEIQNDVVVARELDESEGILTEASISHEGCTDACTVTLQLCVDKFQIPEHILRKQFNLKLSDTLIIAIKGVPGARYRRRKLYVNEVTVVVSIECGSPLRFSVQLGSLITVCITENWQDFSMNLWLKVARCIPQLLLSLTNYCAVCQIVKQPGSINLGRSPSVCESDACYVAFYLFGVNFDMISTMDIGEQIVDLLTLLGIFNAASGDCEAVNELYFWSQRPGIHLEPALTEVLAKMPCSHKLKEILVKPGGHVEMFSSEHFASMSIWRWVISTVARQIIAVPPDKMLPFMYCTQQFVIPCDSSEKERRFQEALSANGGRSVFAFHGSRMENWHSILRQGLQNRGRGIFASPHLRVSASYSPVGYADMYLCTCGTGCDDNTCTSHDHIRQAIMVKCIAVCEIVDSPNLRKNIDNRIIWSVDNPDHICVRFLSLYIDDDIEKCNKYPVLPDHQLYGHVNLQDPAFAEPLKQLLQVSKFGGL